MFIDEDINKGNLHLHVNQQVTSHYEIEDFRDYRSIDLYLQEVIADLVEREVNDYAIDSLMEEFAEI